jgi:outer membrane protein assembly factor BamB
MRVAVPLLSVLVLAALRPGPALTKPPSAEEMAAEARERALKEAVEADEQTLRKVSLPTDAASLLDYLRKRTYPETNPQKMAALVRELGSSIFQEREKAQAEILSLGASALFALRKPEDKLDAETRRRVHSLRLRIEEKADPAVQAATARLIGIRKPAGAAEVLLAYLPFAADDYVVDEAAKALTAVALRDGKADPALVESLQDKSPVKRGVAGEALARAQTAPLPAVRKLLQDAEPRVRLRVGLALARNRDKDVVKDAVPALIEVLAQLPPEQLWGAEDVLVRLAGAQVPNVSLGTDEASRKHASKVWNDWWVKARDKIDLAQLDKLPAYLGYTVIVQQSHRVVNGRFVRIAGEVLELDANKKVRWKFDVENTYPVDAQVVGPDRVLLTEFNGRRISERDLKGEVKWQVAINGNPMSAQRLPNGNTFVVTQNRLVELDKGGREVWAYQRPNNNHDIFRALKVRNGDVLFITNQGMLTRLDARTQRELKSFAVGQIGNIFGSMDVLPNGNVLVPQFGMHRVAEFDPNGREVWHAQVQLPNSVMRLPNGRTLVSSLNTRQVVELDRNGREVWSYQIDGQQLFQARRR